MFLGLKWKAKYEYVKSLADHICIIPFPGLVGFANLTFLFLNLRNVLTLWCETCYIIVSNKSVFCCKVKKEILFYFWIFQFSLVFGSVLAVFIYISEYCCPPLPKSNPVANECIWCDSEEGWSAAGIRNQLIHNWVCRWQLTGRCSKLEEKPFIVLIRQNSNPTHVIFFFRNHRFQHEVAFWLKKKTKKNEWTGFKTTPLHRNNDRSVLMQLLKAAFYLGAVCIQLVKPCVKVIDYSQMTSVVCGLYCLLCCFFSLLTQEKYKHQSLCCNPTQPYHEVNLVLLSHRFFCKDAIQFVWNKSLKKSHSE